MKTKHIKFIVWFVIAVMIICYVKGYSWILWPMIVLALALLIWSVNEREKEQIKEKRESETRYKHRNITKP